MLVVGEETKRWCRYSLALLLHLLPVPFGHHILQDDHHSEDPLCG